MPPLKLLCQKENMRSASFIAAYFFLLFTARTQSKAGFEQYSYMGTGQANTLVPVVHYQSNNKWYAEARYNYDDLETFSLYAGKTFSKENNFSYSLTPMIGGMAGKLKGGSLGLNTEFSFKKFNFCSQSQYSVSAESQNNNFFFSWAELYYVPLDWIYTGLTVQHTRLYKTDAVIEPGLLVGFSIKRWNFPIYTFRPFSGERYFVIGVNWEWKHKSQQKKVDPAVLTKADAAIMQ
jgi:hypothetical protein